MTDTPKTPNTPGDFAGEVAHWSDVPGWFDWRAGQLEAIAAFGDGATIVEVGVYLGRSLLSLAEVVRESGKQITVVGVDTCRGSGAEGPAGIDAHGPAAASGGGTFAGLLHRNVLACGAADDVQVIIGSSTTVSRLFADGSLTWVHVDARHDYHSVAADIDAWAPKVAPGGWLTGDDYDEWNWPEVIAAVRDRAPDAQRWLDRQWRWVKPGS